jgi:hypothetical protein
VITVRLQPGVETNHSTLLLSRIEIFMLLLKDRSGVAESFDGPPRFWPRLRHVWPKLGFARRRLGLSAKAQ